MVYRIKYCGSELLQGKKESDAFKSVETFDGADDKGQGWVAVETRPNEVLRPSPTQVGSDAGVIVLEDDIFPEAVVEAPSEDPVPIQHPPQAEKLVRRSQRERRPPCWTWDYQMDT